MCTVCGCGEGETRIEGHDHGHSNEHGHHHYGHGATHAHAPGLSQTRMVQIEEDILGKNNQYAAANRGWFSKQRILALNLVSSPGSGKTSLLTRSIEDLKPELSLAVHGTVNDVAMSGDRARPGDAILVSGTLNELAQQSGVGMMLDENAIPVDPGVSSACELLGLDPLYVDNEGKLVCICPAADARSLLQVMRKHLLGQNAAISGEVIEDEQGFVQMQTRFGGTRTVDWLAGEQLPRIC